MTARRLPEQAGTLILRAGVVVYASEGVADLVGRSVAEIVGHRVVEFVVPEQRVAVEERHFRRLRGEPVPAASEVALLLPDGGRLLVEAHAERDGADVLVHVRDLASREERRLRLEAVATLGAALQRELAEEVMHARVREGLRELGLSCALMRAEDDRVRIVWASVVPELSARFARLARTPLDGYLGRASAFTRRVAAEGYAFTDDWALEASRLVPEALAAGTREAVAAAGIAKALAVRLEGRRFAGLALLVAGDWLRSDDGPAVRLFGAQLAAALDAARTVADLSRRNADLDAMNRVAELAGRSTELADFFARAAEVLHASAGCRGVAVFVAEAGTGDLVRVYEEGVSPERSRAFERAPAAGRLGSIMREGTPLVGDVTPGGEFARLAILGYRSIAWVPLVARSKAVGVFAAGFDAPAEEVRGRTDLLSAVGAHLAAAIESHALLADLRRRIEELSLLNEVGRTIAGSLDLERVLREGADAARRLVDASRAFVVLYDAPRDELWVGAGAGFGDAELAAFRGSASGASLSARVVRERRPIVVEDVAASADVAEEHRPRLGARSLVAAPVLLRGEPLGVLVVDEVRRARRFTPSEVERIGAVANQLAVAVENARLYAEARGRLQELAAVIDVARVVSSSLDLEHVLGAGAEHLARTLDGAACTILLEEPRAHELRRAVSRGEPIGAERVRLGEPSLALEALEARAPVTGRAPGAGGAETAVLAVPLDVRGRPVGVALVAGGRADRVFTPGELARATAIASQLAVAVDNAALYSETRRRAEELALLHEVGRSLVATLDIDRLLDAGVRNLARIVEAPDAFLALEVPGAGVLEVCAVAGAHREYLGQRFSLEEGPGANLFGLVFRRREPVVIEDGLEDERVNQALRARTGGRGLLGLPLVVRDRTIGAILILDPRAPRLFTPAEVERGAAIANQLAVAVENARLYEDLRRSYGELASAQRQLVQRERLAALGELSAIVAHEVRNPLGVIFNSLGSLRRLLRPSGDAKLLLDIVGEEADRLNRIVGDLLDFARPSTPELHPERLERVVEDALAAALAQRPTGVEIAREHDPLVPPVPMDARLVRQAVLNVAVNAVQAMPRGGRLTVRTRREEGAAVLEVEDTGAGIPEEVRGRIFEPFFTTKASGTGLGLAVVKRIVEGHGGAIAVVSRAGAGTVFALRFPLPASAVEKEPAIG